MTLNDTGKCFFTCSMARFVIAVRSAAESESSVDNAATGLTMWFKAVSPLCT